ncbi:MAG: hypothetical protein A3J30_03430 [Candidatus Wildermuthbacteria bacterium RIFCSPLOWO2_02_FULL_47_9c]|uniref:Metallopeptidase family protein n=2 Tax=Parcubacteria group TaxID=1794811 RepID=A0A837ILI9_9BACT|nr:MAG: hypothetical protein UY25_C0002G0053 [Candidatus Yanofskybacteria bacterium GW2011_GWC1_48_11]KKW04699.1 MAG: hypothetical protein UY38_C0001G0266 [Parcubacteria group bacterium GW2011_GWB1_49_12]KKW09001.1 MAG: hypothetical protein UY45_C0002G0053 [Parcubacteria group bacterium GW2011_GWA1_49_26]KKW14229.1 MAG: hypothetical protein UY53_C0002G0018 [Parcubacteria group bacterium GW2011_GWA2_50_10]OHA61054.1 MAG: hypothetical protein A2109_02265 [Candidatus Wildermuthbacteria bacterium G
MGQTSYSREQFKEMVADALEHFPEHVKKRVKNVALCVEDLPTPEQLEEIGCRREDVLLGLFEGVPETEWGKGFGNVLPDKITIFQKNIERFAQTPEEIAKEVRATVWHEIAHHFGWSDEELEEKEHLRGS